MDKKKLEPLIDILLFHAFVAAAAVITVAALKFVWNDGYKVVEKFYKDKMLDKTSIHEVLPDRKDKNSPEYFE